ncbi:MAG TPA: universal stress protein [Candidatus Binataceae bacterium]|nr:universal stress protein [Candidatus Binataceae bacterium]
MPEFGKFRKILCPIDFTQHALGALAVARDLAQDNGATLHLLHVARVPSRDMDVPLPFGADPRWERAARRKLERMAAERLQGMVAYQIHVVSGTPDVDVLRMAKELDADLIVMATHGRKGLSHLVLGSVAERVVREASCPVLTIRSGGKPR